MLENLDKCLIFINLKLPRFRLQDIKIKPLIQLREMISKALSGQTNLSKPFQSFFIEVMKLFLTIPNRINFLQMGRLGRSSEQRFRMNFRKKFGWIAFNRALVQEGKPKRRAIAIDPSYICKFGKKTPGVGYFWSVIGIYLRTIHSLKDDLLKLSNCLVADAFFSKETFVTVAKALGFAFNMSPSTINVARQFGKEYDVSLSVSDVKELLFYGLRAAV